MGEKATVGQVMVNEFSTGTKHLGDNIIFIAMNRYDAGCIRKLLREYVNANNTKSTHTLAVSKELVEQMEKCF